MSFLGPSKRHKISDPALKAIQKKALLSFYERHNNSNNKNTNNSRKNENTSATNHSRNESVASNNVNGINGNENLNKSDSSKEPWRSEPHLARSLQAPPQVSMRPRTQSSSHNIGSSSRR